MIEAGKRLTGPEGVYEIECLLHQTAAQTTARAERISDGQLVVLKELRLTGLQSWKPLELFERETAILRQLQHPRLPRLVDAFASTDEAETRFYLISSWAEGESLLDRLDAGWAPGAEEVLDIARQTLEILDYLHRFNPPVIHRDLKPGNLIMDESGRIHLVDFGAVQGLLNPDGGSTVVGTFGYMPPEQFSDRCVPATDLYALGATLAHLLTGIYPSDLPRKGMRIVLDENLGCEPAILPWLERLLAPEVETRFGSAAETLLALDSAQDAASLGSTIRKQGQRIEVNRRGARLRIAIRPAAPGRNFGLRGGLSLTWLSLMTCWHWLDSQGMFGSYKLTNFVSNLTGMDYSEAYRLVNGYDFNLFSELCNHWFLPEFAGLLSVYVLGQGLLNTCLQTRILVQPERYRITHSLGPLSWHAEGSSSELIRLQRQFSPLRMAWLSRWVERAQIKLTGGVQLNQQEHQELAGHLGSFLAQRQPEQAEGLLLASRAKNQALNPRPGWLPSPAQLSASAHTGLKAGALRRSVNAGLGWILPPTRHPGLYREVPWTRAFARIHHLDPSDQLIQPIGPEQPQQVKVRVEGQASERALKLRIAPAPRLWQNLGLAALWTQGAALPGFTALNADMTKVMTSLVECLSHGWKYGTQENLDIINLLGIKYFVFGLINLLVFGLLSRSLLTSLSRRELELDAEGLSLNHKPFLARKRSRRISLRDWQDLYLHQGLGEGFGKRQLRVYQAGGASETLASRLNRAEAHLLTSILAAHIDRYAYKVSPQVAQSLSELKGQQTPAAERPDRQPESQGFKAGALAWLGNKLFRGARSKAQSGSLVPVHLSPKALTRTVYRAIYSSLARLYHASRQLIRPLRARLARRG